MKRIYNSICIEKPNYKAIYPVWSQFCIRNKIQKKAGKRNAEISSWLFQSIGIMRDFIFFFVLCFLFSIFQLSTYYTPNCSVFGLFTTSITGSNGLLKILIHKYLCVYLSIHVKWNLESRGMPTGHMLA